MAYPFAMLGVLSYGDIDVAFVNHRRGNDVVAGAATAQFPDRQFGVGVEFPEQLGMAVFCAFRIETIHPAVTTGEDDLRLTREFGVGRRRPLTMQDVESGRFVRPQHLAAVFVHGKEAGGIGRWDVVVFDVDTV